MDLYEEAVVLVARIHTVATYTRRGRRRTAMQQREVNRMMETVVRLIEDIDEGIYTTQAAGSDIPDTESSGIKQVTLEIVKD
jgi:hypothetical protein